MTVSIWQVFLILLPPLTSSLRKDALAVRRVLADVEDDDFSLAHNKTATGSQLIPESYLLAWYAGHVALNLAGKHMAKDRMNYMRYAKAVGSPLGQVDWKRLPFSGSGEHSKAYWAEDVT